MSATSFATLTGSSSWFSPSVITMMARLFSLCTLKERAAIDKASPIAVPWMGTDSVVMEFKNILADM